MKILKMLLLTHLIFTNSWAFNEMLTRNPAQNCQYCEEVNHLSNLYSKYNSLIDNYLKLGGDRIAINQALCFFNKYRTMKFMAKDDQSRNETITIDNQHFITINDLTKPSSQARL